jgi:hypothetical protein
VFTHTHDPRYLVAHDEPIPAGVTDSEVLMAKSFRIESSGADETADDDDDDGGILVNVLPPLLAPTSSDSRRDAAFFAPMCPLFNLVQAFVKKSSGGSLEDIDALLGCGMWRSVLHMTSCSTHAVMSTNRTKSTFADTTTSVHSLAIHSDQHKLYLGLFACHCQHPRC